MNLIINIEQQIQEWKNESKGHNDYWIRVASYLTEFQSLTKLKLYISDDAENYYSIDCYKELLENIGMLIAPEVAMSSVVAKNENDFWAFAFELNNRTVRLEIEDPNTDWLQADFLKDFNAHLDSMGIDKQLKMVFATSENNADQCFDIAFIDDKTFEKLLMHSPRYAYKDS
ncbi:MAG: hypothetical protein ACPG5B_13785 [Chitinophagales bacterium]